MMKINAFTCSPEINSEGLLKKSISSNLDANLLISKEIQRYLQFRKLRNCTCKDRFGWIVIPKHNIAAFQTKDINGVLNVEIVEHSINALNFWYNQQLTRDERRDVKVIINLDTDEIEHQEIFNLLDTMLLKSKNVVTIQTIGN